MKVTFYAEMHDETCKGCDKTQVFKEKIKYCPDKY